nr:zinc knuckle CX2CX4HX4C [Tanacetum cinerariifolium]
MKKGGDQRSESSMGNPARNLRLPVHNLREPQKEITHVHKVTGGEIVTGVGTYDNVTIKENKSVSLMGNGSSSIPTSDKVSNNSIGYPPIWTKVTCANDRLNSSLYDAINPREQGSTIVGSFGLSNDTIKGSNPTLSTFERGNSTPFVTEVTAPMSGTTIVGSGDYSEGMNTRNFLAEILLGSIFSVVITSTKEFTTFLEKSKTDIYDEVMTGMTSYDYNAAQEELKVLSRNFETSGHDNAASSDLIPNYELPIVQSVVINLKPSFYAGEVVASSAKTKSVRLIFTLCNLKTCMMGLNYLYYLRLNGSPIILKKWTKYTSPLKEELTRISVWVKLHDVHLQVFLEDGISLIATKIDWCAIVKLNVKYMPKAVVNVPKTRASNVINTLKPSSYNAPTSKNNPPKSSVLPESSSGGPKGKNGGTNSNIPVSNSYAVLDEESKEELKMFLINLSTF